MNIFVFVIKSDLIYSSNSDLYKGVYNYEASVFVDTKS